MWVEKDTGYCSWHDLILKHSFLRREKIRLLNLKLPLPCHFRGHLGREWLISAISC